MASTKKAAGRPARRAKTGLRHTELAHSLLRQFRDRFWLTAGQRIAVAVSGGADSVALLRLLLDLRDPLGIVLSVAHFNHQLRGRAADADEKFVAKLAAQHGLPFRVARQDIAAKAKRDRANLEETARRARYAFFERLVAEGHVERVAVAHTADDQAETVLSHILRGTGIAGLAGIHPEAGPLFRPLLNFRRAELRLYLRAQKQTWREDLTNRDTKRTRARIRRKLIPFLEKQFQPAVVEHLCQLSDLAREDDAWMECLANARVNAVAKQDQGAWKIPLRELLEGSSGRTGALAKRIIRTLVKRAKLHRGQLNAIHVDSILQLTMSRDSGRSVHLPGGVEVRRERDSLCFRPLDPQRKTLSGPQPFSYQIDLRSNCLDLRVVELSCLLRFRVIDWPSQGRETIKIGAVLDREKLGVPLVVRNWSLGDRLQPLGHQKSHALARLLNELGVSRWAKQAWPVLVCHGSIAWARGLPVAAAFAATPETRTAVVITEVPLT